MSDTDKRYFRIVEKRGNTFIVDWEGNPISPAEAQKVAQSITQTVESRSYVYVGFRGSDGLYKIGRTIDLERRKSELGVDFVHTIECDFYGDLASNKVETALHGLFKHLNCHVEDEWFRLTENDLYLIQNNCIDASKTLQFVSAFRAASDWLDATLEDGEGIIKVVARILNREPSTRDHFKRLVTVYNLLEIILACKAEGKSDEAAYYYGIYQLWTTVINTSK